jgi:hypothetical protein
MLQVGLSERVRFAATTLESVNQSDNKLSIYGALYPAKNPSIEVTILTDAVND